MLHDMLLLVCTTGNCLVHDLHATAWVHAGLVLGCPPGNYLVYVWCMYGDVWCMMGYCPVHDGQASACLHAGLPIVRPCTYCRFLPVTGNSLPDSGSLPSSPKLNDPQASATRKAASSNNNNEHTHPARSAGSERVQDRNTLTSGYRQPLCKRGGAKRPSQFTINLWNDSLTEGRTHTPLWPSGLPDFTFPRKPPWPLDREPTRKTKCLDTTAHTNAHTNGHGSINI